MNVPVTQTERRNARMRRARNEALAETLGEQGWELIDAGAPSVRLVFRSDRVGSSPDYRLIGSVGIVDVESTEYVVTAYDFVTGLATWSVKLDDVPPRVVIAVAHEIFG